MNFLYSQLNLKQIHLYPQSKLKRQTLIYITIKIKNLKILQHFRVMESIINRTEKFVIYAMIIAKGQLS